MKKELLVSLLREPQTIGADNALELKKLIRIYPYCQALYALLAKAQPTDEQVTQAATRTLDRGRLRQLLAGQAAEPLPTEWQKLALHTDNDYDLFDKLRHEGPGTGPVAEVKPANELATPEVDTLATSLPPSLDLAETPATPLGDGLDFLRSTAPAEPLANPENLVTNWPTDAPTTNEVAKAEPLADELFDNEPITKLDDDWLRDFEERYKDILSGQVKPSELTEVPLEAPLDFPELAVEPNPLTAELDLPPVTELAPPAAPEEPTDEQIDQLLNDPDYLKLKNAPTQPTADWQGLYQDELTPPVPDAEIFGTESEQPVVDRDLETNLGNLAQPSLEITPAPEPLFADPFADEPTESVTVNDLVQTGPVGAEPPATLLGEPDGETDWDDVHAIRKEEEDWHNLADASPAFDAEMPEAQLLDLTDHDLDDIHEVRKDEEIAYFQNLAEHEAEYRAEFTERAAELDHDQAILRQVNAALNPPAPEAEPLPVTPVAEAPTENFFDFIEPEHGGLKFKPVTEDTFGNPLPGTPEAPAEEPIGDDLSFFDQPVPEKAPAEPVAQLIDPQQAIIDEFIRLQPSLNMERVKTLDENNLPDLSLPSTQWHPDLVSETLARIYAQQGKLSIATEMYHQLAQKFPDRAAEFLTKADGLK
jgi:hypothetical protein